MADRSKVRVEARDDGALWHVLLAAPKANVLDGEMMTALRDVFVEAGESEPLKAIVLEGEGPSFSYGASVGEHLPEQVAAMLETFHGLLHALADASVPVLAAVRGQCLGGGLELAAFCHRIFAAPDAKLAQPEIKLGVFAPIASLLLPERIGRGAAEDLCLSGRSLTAEEARQIGLVDVVAVDPSQAAFDYAREHLFPHSARSLRFAVRAVRHELHLRLFGALGDIERLYLDELMQTHDANEGIRAFLAKRPPEWRNA